MRWLFWPWFGATAVVACAAPEQPPTRVDHPRRPATTDVHPTPPARPPDLPSSAAPKTAQEPHLCGALGCRAFDSVEQAVAFVLESNPRVLAVGEAHAPRGTEGIDSAVRRFTRSLLPMVASRAKALVVELPVSEARCGSDEQKLAEIRKEVSRGQSQQNPNEYLQLANAARDLGVVPYPLRLTCGQFATIAKAGPDDIPAALTVIAEAMEHQVKECLRRWPEGLVLTYGGALHNDLAPEPRRANWSFGPGLCQATDNAYVELDLIVREYIKANDAWGALEWTHHFDPQTHPDETILYEPVPKSYVMIFPTSRPPQAAAPPAGQ
jgi:hypothetical protein